jgi:hypothetical protein
MPSQAVSHSGWCNTSDSVEASRDVPNNAHSPALTQGQDQCRCQPATW